VPPRFGRLHAQAAVHGRLHGCPAAKLTPVQPTTVMSTWSSKSPNVRAR
jgi:hypothetical protein